MTAIVRYRLIQLLLGLTIAQPFLALAQTVNPPANPPEIRTAAGSKPQVRLEWCLDHFPPRQFYQRGQQPTGPMVDLMQQLAQRSGFELAFSPPTPTIRCLKLMQQGKTDLMTGLLWSASREQFMLLMPYDEARPDALFVRKNQPITSADQLAGREIGLLKQHPYSADFRQLLQKYQLTVRWSEDLDQALALLHFGQVDAVASSYHFTLQRIGQSQRLQQSIIPNHWQPVTDPASRIHLALARTSPHFQLHLIINQQLQQLVNAGHTHFYQEPKAQ